MSFNRIRMSKEATYKSRNAGGKLGITPNIIYRFGLCLSMDEPSIPNPLQYGEDGQEINRHVLFGDWDPFFIALMKQRIVEDGLDISRDFEPQLRAHLNRGAMIFTNRVRDLSDIYELLHPSLASKPSKIESEMKGGAVDE